MIRFVWAAVAALLPGCTLYFGGSDDVVADDTGPTSDPPGERLDRDHITGVISGQLADAYWNHDELFVTWGTQGMMGETVSWGPTSLVSLFGSRLQQEIEPVRVQGGGLAITIADHHQVTVFGPGFPQTLLPHTINDVIRTDVDGNGKTDYVTTGDGILRRCNVPNYLDPEINEMTLLSNKPYLYIAVANLAGSSLPDILYVTKGGQIGLLTQTSADVFTDEVLGNGTQPQRLQIADVDGDGLEDVVGASPNVFIYSTKAQAFIQLSEPARAISAGDIDGDGVAEPVFLTPDGVHVRRVAGLTTSNAPSTKLVLDTTEAQTFTVANMDGDAHSDVALVHEAGQATSWLELRLATSFSF